MPDVITRDPLRLRTAYAKVLPLAQALAPTDRDVLNANPSEAASLCIQAGAAVLAEPLAGDFAKLPADFFDHAAVAKLEQYGYAFAFVTDHLQDALTLDSERRIPKALADESAETRDRMIRVIKYRLASNAAVMALLDDILAGIGYHDRASDLTRISGIFSGHEAELAKDDLHYRPTDREHALDLAARIREEIKQAGASAAAAVKDQRDAIWTLASRAYAEVRRGAAFMEPARPGLLDRFPALNSYGQSSKKAAAPAPTPATPEQPTA
jgi:hypothetical protein